MRTYDPSGICGTVEGVGGGGHEPNVAMFCDLCYGTGAVVTDTARAIQARQAKGCSTHYGECSGVAVPVLTPDREEKRQNGRRFKDDGEDMFTLTGQDRHGVAVSLEPVGGREPE